MPKMLKFASKIIALISLIFVLVVAGFNIFGSDETIVVVKDFSGGSQCRFTYPAPSPQDIKNLFNILGIKIIDLRSQPQASCNACGCPNQPISYVISIPQKHIQARILGFK